MKRQIFFLALVAALCCAACAPADGEPEFSLPEEPAAFAVPEVAENMVDADIYRQAVANEEGQEAEEEALSEISPESALAEQRQTSASETDVAVQPASAEPESVQAAPTQPVDDAAASAVATDEPTVLSISGEGVGGETAWTLARLQSLAEGYREITYSTTNNWPSFSYIAVQGVSLPYLLRKAGLLDSAAGFKFIATDGYYVTVTYEQIFGKRYTYSDHSATGSGGAVAVEPVIAWAWGDVGKVKPESIRSFFGQSGPLEVNTSAFVKDLCKIEVSATSPGQWTPPTVSLADGSLVPTGTELKLMHDAMDSVRIYYTLDGSEPDYNSPVYNPSTSYFQPQLITPLVLEHSVTVKAFAAALGKEKSPVVIFSFTVM